MDEQAVNATYQALANQRNAALDQAASLTAQCTILIGENAALKKALSEAGEAAAAVKEQVDLLQQRNQAQLAQAAPSADEAQLP